MINAQTGGESDYAYQLKSVPSTSSSWNFSYIRNVNIMLQNIDKSSMNDTEKGIGEVLDIFSCFKIF